MGEWHERHSIQSAECVLEALQVVLGREVVGRCLETEMQEM